MFRIIAALVVTLSCTIAQAQSHPKTLDVRSSAVLPSNTHWMLLTANADGTESIICDQPIKQVPPQIAVITIGNGWIMITWPKVPDVNPVPDSIPPSPVPNPIPISPVTPIDIPRIIGDIMVLTIIPEPPNESQQALIDSKTIGPELDKLHAKWYPCTTKAPGIDDWLKDPKISAVGAPVLVFITKNAAGINSTVYAMRLQNTEAEIILAVRRTRSEGGK